MIVLEEEDDIDDWNAEAKGSRKHSRKDFGGDTVVVSTVGASALGGSTLGN